MCAAAAEVVAENEEEVVVGAEKGPKGYVAVLMAGIVGLAQMVWMVGKGGMGEAGDPCQSSLMVWYMHR